MAVPTGFSWLGYTLEQDDGGPLHCLEATLSGTDDEPLGVLSRWGTDTAGDSIPDLVVESEVSDPRGDDAERAVEALRSWLGHARVTLGDWSREGFERDLRVQPDAVGRVPDALVVDGVVLPGTIARRGDVTARVAHHGDRVLAVVHRGSVAGPVRLVAGMPRVHGFAM
jgi:hypothetical protein